MNIGELIDKLQGIRSEFGDGLEVLVSCADDGTLEPAGEVTLMCTSGRTAEISAVRIAAKGEA